MRKLLAILLALVSFSAQAAFPTIVSTTTTQIAAGADPEVLNLGTYSIGHLLLCFLSTDGGLVSATTPSGWTAVVALASDGANNVHGVAYARIADGSEGSTLSIDVGVAQQAVGTCFKINGYDSLQLPQGASAGGSTANPDPPNVTPTGGAKDYLWFVWFGKDTSDNIVSAYPTNYTDNQTSSDDGNTGTPGVGTAEAFATRNLNASSEDPGTFTMGESEQWVAMTVAVHPGAGGASSSTVVNPLSGRGGGAAQPVSNLMRRMPAANDDHFVAPKRVAGL